MGESNNEKHTNKRRDTGREGKRDKDKQIRNKLYVTHPHPRTYKHRDREREEVKGENERKKYRNKN